MDTPLAMMAAATLRRGTSMSTTKPQPGEEPLYVDDGITDFDGNTLGAYDDDEEVPGEEDDPFE